jgi:DNA-binding NtrC family response regulator
MGEKTNILVVDDDINFCNTLTKILAKKGYETTSANSGFKALELIKEKSIDVVIMDIKMPVMNGVEAYKKIKEIRPDIKVILMTAFSVEALISAALKEGVYAVIRKPFDADTIINTIERSKHGAFIAIVDDDPNLCKTMKAVLERKGYSVNTCLTGEDAILLAEERKQDIFCIDMKLPVLNGLETYLRIKKINPNAIVLMMTAYRQEMDELIKEVMKNGAYTCIYKPFDMDKVLEMIDKLSERLGKNG